MTGADVRQEAKREQIRRAAAELFLARGFSGVSTDAITAAAGVSKETLYRYYPGKEALFAAVLGQLIAEPAGESRNDSEPLVVRELADLEGLLVSRSGRYLARVLERDQVALLRVVIAEGSRFPELVSAFRGTLPAAGGALIIPVLEAGRSAGLVAAAIDIRDAARAFAGLLMMFILRDGLLAPEPKRPSRRQLEDVVRLFLHGVAARPDGHA